MSDSVAVMQHLGGAIPKPCTATIQYVVVNASCLVVPYQALLVLAIPVVLQTKTTRLGPRLYRPFFLAQ